MTRARYQLSAQNPTQAVQLTWEPEYLVLMNPQPYKVFVRLGGPDAPNERNYDLVLPENTMMAMPVGSFMFGLRLGASTQAVVGTAVTVLEFLKDEPAPAFGSVPLSSVVADVSGSTINVGNTPNVSTIQGSKTEQTQPLNQAASWFGVPGIAHGASSLIYTGTYDNVNASEELIIQADSLSEPILIQWYSQPSNRFMRQFSLQYGIPLHIRIPFLESQFSLSALAIEAPTLSGVGLSIASRKVPTTGFQMFSSASNRIRSMITKRSGVANTNYRVGTALPLFMKIRTIIVATAVAARMQLNLTPDVGDTAVNDPDTAFGANRLPIAILRFPTGGGNQELHPEDIFTHRNWDTVYLYTGQTTDFDCTLLYSLAQ